MRGVPICRPPQTATEVVDPGVRAGLSMEPRTLVEDERIQSDIDALHKFITGEQAPAQVVTDKMLQAALARGVQTGTFKRCVLDPEAAAEQAFIRAIIQAAIEAE